MMRKMVLFWLVMVSLATLGTYAVPLTARAEVAELILEHDIPTAATPVDVPEYVETGSWAKSSLNGYTNSGGSRHTTTIGSAATWTPQRQALDAGYYKVSYYGIKRTDSANDENATITVFHNSKIEEIIYNQSAIISNGWVMIGTYQFTGDEAEYVMVTKKNGNTKYLVADAVRFEKVVATNDDATLQNLSFSAGTLDPVFDSATEHYAVSTESTATTIIASPTNSSAVVSINGTTVSNGVATSPYNLPMGATQFSIVVTAADGSTTKTYTVDVNRNTTVVTINDSSAYSETAGTWGSSGYVKGYNGLNTKYSPTEGATAEFKTGINQPGVYNIQFYKTVHSSNDSNVLIGVVHNGIITEKYIDLQNGSSGWVDLGNYYFNGDGTEIVRAFKTLESSPTSNLRVSAIKVSLASFTGNETDLDAITLSTGILPPVFMPEQTEYMVDVGYLTNSMRITPYAKNLEAVVTVNGTDVGYGMQSCDIALGSSTQITIRVVSKDTTESKIYTINVNKLPYEIIDYGMPGYSEQETWGTSDTYYGQSGSSTRFITGSTEGTVTEPSVTFTPQLTVPQRIVVKVYKIVTPGQSDQNVKWQVTHGGITDIFYLDYSQGESGWVTLGVFDFAAGGEEYVKMIRITPMTDTTVTTRVDAIRFEPVPADEVVVGEPVYKNSAGEVIHDIESGTVNVSISIENNTDADFNIFMAAALYDLSDSSKMLNISFGSSDKIEAKHSGTVTATLEIDENQAGNGVKTFLWDGLDTMIPAGKAILFK